VQAAAVVRDGDDEKESIYMYADSILSIAFEPDPDVIKFTCNNHTTSPISLIWDNSVFVGLNGVAERGVCGDTKGIHIGLSQPPSIIYPNYPLVTSIHPYNYGWSQWLVNSGRIGEGSPFHIVLPILSGNTTYVYDFCFTIVNTRKVFDPNRVKAWAIIISSSATLVAAVVAGANN
jgi:hypothetical protein